MLQEFQWCVYDDSYVVCKNKTLIQEGGCMKNLSTLTLQEKEQLMMHLGKLYRKGMLQVNLSFQGMVEDRNGDASDIEIASRIQLIMRQMIREQALLLLNDYFEIKKSDWWKKQYTQSMYMCTKSLAMDEFLRCLYA